MSDVEFCAVGVPFGVPGGRAVRKSRHTPRARSNKVRLSGFPVLIGLFNHTEASKGVKYLIMGFVTAVLIVLASLLSFGYLNGAYLWWIILNGVAVIGAQMFGYAIFKDALDRVAEKFNPWKPIE